MASVVGRDGLGAVFVLDTSVSIVESNGAVDGLSILT